MTLRAARTGETPSPRGAAAATPKPSASAPAAGGRRGGGPPYLRRGRGETIVRGALLVLLLAAAAACLAAFAARAERDAVWLGAMLVGVLLALRWHVPGALVSVAASLLALTAVEGLWLDGVAFAPGQPRLLRWLLVLADLLVPLTVGWLAGRLADAKQARRTAESGLRTVSEEERSRRASDGRFRALVQNAGDLVMVIDADLRRGYVSPASKRVLGCAPGELIGGEFLTGLHPDDAPRAVHFLVTHLDGTGTEPTVELRHQHRDDSWRTLEWAVSNLIDDPDVAGVMLCARDLTERRRDGAALRESEARYRTLFEHAPVGIYRTDAEGRLSLANPALLRMLGFESLDQVAGNRLPWETTARVGGQTATTDAAEVAGEVVEWRRRDGALLHLRRSARAIRDAAGAVRSVEGAVEDVTEQYALEERLQQAEKLSALGELAAGVAHEINNPLAAVTGTAELAMRHTDDPDLRADLFQIHREASRAGEIARALLRFARQREPSFERMQIVAVLDEALALQADRLSRFQIEVRRELERVPDVMADQDHLLQVILNLINNAVDAMKADERGVLRVRVQAVGEGVALCVWDSGPGIPPDVLGRIFNPFFTTKRTGEGTGLGLAISHRLVLEHGGTLTAENAGGALFKVTLPAAPIAPYVMPAAAHERVLIYHPDPMRAESLAEAVRLLEREPLALTYGDDPATAGAVAAIVAPDAPAALLARLRACRPDLRLIAAEPAGRAGEWQATLPAAYRLTDLERALACA